MAENLNISIITRTMMLFSFVFSGRNEKSGVWNAAEPVSFYSVKAGNQYAMYWVNPALSTGLFSTEHLTVGNGRNNPDLSHITFWMVEDTYVLSSVPEPSTMVLFGLGLIGLAGISRKKRKKQQAQQLQSKYFENQCAGSFS